MKPATEQRVAGTHTRATAARLPAVERRSAIVDAALRVFSTGSYSGATTADLARAAGVSEPILYRHFGSKRELYFACLDEAWQRLEATIDTAVVELGPVAACRRLAPSALRDLKVVLPHLWMQAVTEAGEDAEIRRFARQHMRGVHDYFAKLLRKAQVAGDIPADRDVEAEAWIFIAGGLLSATADRLGGPLDVAEFAAITSERRRWLYGSA
jgi:AcrR family transcriptional regulator